MRTMSEPHVFRYTPEGIYAHSITSIAKLDDLISMHERSGSGQRNVYLDHDSFYCLLEKMLAMCFSVVKHNELTWITEFTYLNMKVRVAE